MINKLSKIKAVISDWDDTKVKTYDSCVKLYAEFATAKALPIPSEEDIQHLWGKHLPDIFQGLFPGENLKELLEFVDETDFCIQPIPFNETICITN